MGLLSSIASIAAPIAGTIFGGPAGGAIGGALGGLFGGSSQSGTQTTSQQQTLDPRIQSMLFGDGTSGNTGLLAQYQSMLNKPEDANLASYGNANLGYLGSNGASNLNTATGAANTLIGGNSAPTSSAASSNAVSASLPAYAVGNQVQAPGQNNIDLTGSYNSLLSGGNTAALNSSLNAAVGATNAGFNTNVSNLTNTLQRSVLPSIRGGAIAAGQYGSSRQGIAEGNAISDYTNQLNNANTQLAATNSANTTAQAASAYQQGQDRALSATQGLGAQQYGVASQNAANAQQAQLTNVANSYDASKTNAGYAQQTNLANQAAQQQTNLANQSSQLSTNSMNNGALATGAGLLSGLSNQAYGVGTAQNNYGLTQAQGVNGLLAPYLTANSGSTTSSPLYSNQAGSVLGGALAGSQLGNLASGTTDYNAIRNTDGGGGLLSGLFSGTKSLSNTPSSVASYYPTTSQSIPSLGNLWG